MLSKTFTLLFYLKRRSNYVAGDLPIYLRVTVEGERFEMATQRHCHPNRWNSVFGRKNGNREGARVLNAYLDSLQASVYEAQRSISNVGRQVTAKRIGDKLVGVQERPSTICGWITIKRQKTDVPSRIPLLPIPEYIMKKYSIHPKCGDGKVLPILSNQKMNSYLKEIGDVCGIRKEITFHLARHTFATTVTLANDVGIESVSRMLGHRNIRTTQHYAKIVDEKISNDMISLSEKLVAKKELRDSAQVKNHK